MASVSFYKDTFDLVGVQVDHLKILTNIRDGKWQSKIQQLLTFEKKSEDFERIKKLLPAVCFAGVFSNREDKNLIEMSKMIVLDIDNITSEQIAAYKKSFADNNSILAAFTSPSGTGLKVIVAIDIDSEDDFIPMFVQLEEEFKNTYGIKVDPSGKNISRLCYVSYDPDIYIDISEFPIPYQLDKEKAAEFKKGTIAKFDERPEKYRGRIINSDAKYSFGVCEKWTQRNHQYVEGNRNNYIHVLACNMNRAGIDFHDAVVMTYSNYPDLPIKEVETTLESAYKRKSEHGSIDIYVTEHDKLPDHTEEMNMTVEEETIFKDTMHLLERDVDKKLIAKLMKSFGSSFLSLPEAEVMAILKKTLEKYRELSQKDAIQYFDISSAIESFLASKGNLGGVPTGVAEFDKVLNGGLQKGQFVGLIGNGGAFKSLMAQLLCSSSIERDEPALYLCGEMSLGQLMPRVIEEYMQIMNMAEMTPELFKELEEKLKGRLYIITSSGWSEEGIFATIEKIREETGKNVGLVAIDGLSQMEDKKNDEIKSAIYNSEICKKIAKHANAGAGTVVVALIHLSGGPPDDHRNTDKFVRGGTKVINNMDLYFCHSKIIDQDESNMESGDIFYHRNMFYLRLKDKRGSGEIISKIIKVYRPTRIEALEIEPSELEVKKE